MSRFPVRPVPRDRGATEPASPQDSQLDPAGMGAAAHSCSTLGKGTAVLWMLACALLAVWILAMVTSYSLGGLLQIVLLFAVVVGVMRLLHRRRPIA